MKRMLAALCLLPAFAVAQSATIHVHADETIGPIPWSWAYFGYDEPNYTYAPNGKKLIRELTELSRTPVHLRTHFLLASGEGKAGLKFGLTNAYSEDREAHPKYDWTVVDQIVGTYVDSGATPFLEVGFMPQALSTHPEPYSATWVPGKRNENYYAGWTYPPNDYRKWADLIYAWVRHSVEKYGKAEVAKWDWEVWNEPNIGYWHGTPEEYDKLYDYTADAIKRALPDARVGGPASTGPGGTRAAEFLQQFLEHCANGPNYVSGKKGSPLDFISFHAKGQPRMVDGRNVMGLASELKDAARGFEIVHSFARFAKLPIVLSEADPDGCAACAASVYPQNAYRNGNLYAAYEAAAYKAMLTLAEEKKVHLEGVLTWAFEFEEQPYFEGFRTLATNGVDKPVLNFFRMAGLMSGMRAKTESTGALGAEALLGSGAMGSGDIDAIAAKSNHNITVLLWNYRDEEQPNTRAQVQLDVSGIPEGSGRLLVRHYRIDDQHSNSYTSWKQMGRPQQPTKEQFAELEDSGQLETISSPVWMNRSSASSLHFSLPSESLSLVEISWR
jgi:xylan 1,4-beta-xylosidase